MVSIVLIRWNFKGSQVTEVENADHVEPQPEAHLQLPDDWNGQSPEAYIRKDVAS
jgi:hypothetical protein